MTGRGRAARRVARAVRATVVAAATLCLVPPAPAATANTTHRAIAESDRQKQAVEAQREALHKQLEALKRDMHRTESARGEAADALAHSESAISVSTRKLHDLTAEQSALNDRLDLLTQRQETLRAAIAARRAQLASLLRQQYRTGDSQRLQLLSSGEDPERIARELQYMTYVSRAQAHVVEGLRKDLDEVERDQKAVQDARDRLARIADEQQQQKSKLEQQKTQHAALVAQLSGKLEAQRREAGHLQRDEDRLSSLVERLSKILAEQRRRAEEEAQRRRQLAEAQRKKRAAEHAARMARRQAGKDARPAASRPDAIDDDENPALSQRDAPDDHAAVEPGGPIAGPGFASLRGRLPFPVRGQITGRFGTRRADGPATKGIFIRAPEGSDVHAIAAGRVVFADWLRGFGNLIIVEHRDEYLSIYGNNQAILKHVGDLVAPGETIARAGNSGGNEYSGLYFELRSGGRAIDPMQWIAAR